MDFALAYDRLPPGERTPHLRGQLIRYQNEVTTSLEDRRRGPREEEIIDEQPASSSDGDDAGAPGNGPGSGGGDDEDFQPAAEGLAIAS